MDEQCGALELENMLGMKIFAIKTWCKCIPITSYTQTLDASRGLKITIGAFAG